MNAFGLIKDLNNSVGVLGWIEVGPGSMNNTFKKGNLVQVQDWIWVGRFELRSFSRIKQDKMDLLGHHLL